MHRYLSRALMNARVSGMHGKAANRRKRSDQPYSDGPAGIGQEAMPIIRISPATRLLLAGNTVSMLGTGLVVAFTLIYLHQVRGIALPVVGGLLAAAGAAGLLVVPLAGILLDRIGARRVLTGILVGQAAAQVLLAWAHNAVTALPVLLLSGATWSPMCEPDAHPRASHRPDLRVSVLGRSRRARLEGPGCLAGPLVDSVRHLIEKIRKLLVERHARILPPRSGPTHTQFSARRWRQQYGACRGPHDCDDRDSDASHRGDRGRRSHRLLASISESQQHRRRPGRHRTRSAA
jgi:hypothetical protein